MIPNSTTDYSFNHNNHAQNKFCTNVHYNMPTKDKLLFVKFGKLASLDVEHSEESHSQSYG